MVAFLSMASTVNAQLRFGFKGEVGINKPSFTKEVYSVENMNAFKIGPSVEFTVPVAGLGVEGSLLYSNEKMNVKNVEKNGVGSVIEEISSHYIDVPVNLKYKMGIISPLKVYLAAGPYAQFKVGGDEFTYEALKGKVDDKKFQAGVNVGIGAEVINRVQLGFNYRLKLTDDYSTNEPKLKDVLNENKGFWSIAAAVYF